MAFLPYPRHPPRGCTCLKCTNQANRAYPPTEFAEPTETTGRGYPPTDFTDAHRWLGCVGFSHGIHRIHRSFWRRRASPGFHRCPRMVRLRKVLWLLWENSLVGSVGMAGMPYPPNLCTSVKSVGGSSPPETSVGRWFSGCVGMASCHTLLIRYLWEFS